jgi:membrane-associated phospholipid phosphatase
MAIAIATAVAGVAAITVRAATGRTRPSNKIEQGWFGPYHDGQWAAFRHSYSSFPSGHTATAVAFAASLTYVARRWGWLSLFWMMGVGWSRICLESHYFSDVIAGSIFGLVTAWLVLRGFGWPRMGEESTA